MPSDLKGMTQSETELWAKEMELAPFRGRQIRHWLFKELAESFDQMTSLSKDVRSLLKDFAVIEHCHVAQTRLSSDWTRKFLFRLEDGVLVESVLIPEKDHFTVCISSQAGCAMGCRFCLTAKQGFTRNLKSSEIVDQVVQVRRFLKESTGRPEDLTNVVFMGMGEPLANFEEVIGAINNIIASDALNFSHRRVTLSTSGLVPQIKRLGEEARVNLAVSLNASDDETRSRLMPVNRKYPLKELMEACRSFPLPNRRMLTFEYILIAGVNDSDEDAFRLSRLLAGMRAKINLIPLNPHKGLDMSSPVPEQILRFQNILIDKHFTAIIRKSKGQDIGAACGQLKGQWLESA